MKNSKLIKILKSFSKEDIKDFEKLIISPFFSTGRNLMPFFKEVKKFYPEFEDENLTNERIYQKLYPGKSYSMEIMKKLKTDLMTLSIEYIKQAAMRENNINVNSLTSFKAMSMNLDFLAKKLISDAESILDAKKFNGLYYEKMEVLQSAREQFMYDKDLSHSIEVSIKSSDFILKKFTYYANIALTNLIQFNLAYNIEIEDTSFKKFIDLVDLESFANVHKPGKTPEDKFFLINIYFLLNWKHLDKNDYFDRLKDLLFENVALFDNGAQYTMLLNLKYIANFKISKYKFKKFESSIFEINKFNLENKIFISPHLNYFPKKEFVNYFLSGYELEEYKWCKDFTETYSEDLSNDDRKDAVNYCKAFLSFADKKFEECLDHINGLSCNDDYEKVFSYYMSIAVFYELNFIEEAISKLESYSKFLKRENKVRSDRLDLHLNFIKCLRSLLSYSSKREEFYIDNAESIISNKKNNILLKRWFIEKIKAAKRL